LRDRLNDSMTQYPNAFMADPAHLLQQIYLAGFELKTFERFPKCVGVVRDDCIVLMVPGPDGLQMLGTPGWQIGEVMGVLTEVGGRQVFQAKAEIVEATPERLEKLRRFREELHNLIRTTK
jgi:hypothetical protein